MPTSNRAQRQRRGALILGLLLIALAAACGGSGSTTDAGSGDGGDADFVNVTRDDPFQVGTATLPEVTPGAEGDFTFTAPPGELLFVFFGYTHCPDVCPTTLSFYKAALEQLGPELADNLTLAMVTIDPERDTPEVMDEFLGFYADDYHAVRTTDYDELLAVEALFGTSSSVGTTPDGKEDVVHSGTAYLVDDQGTVLVEFPFGVSTADLTHDLELALGALDG